jgi:hypothetical protein
MWTRLRAWWYGYFIKVKAWPPDVREYVVRSGLKIAKNSNLSPKQQSEIAAREVMIGLSGGEEDLSAEFKAELLRDGMSRLGQIPLEHCADCGRPVFTHEANWIDGKPHCKSGDCYKVKPPRE